MKTLHLGILFIAIVIIGGIFVYQYGTKLSFREPKVVYDYCYHGASQVKGSFYDRSWVRLHISDETVTGGIVIAPAYKDSQWGAISGAITSPYVVGSVGQFGGTWSVTSGLMHNTEDLMLAFTDSWVAIGYGTTTEVEPNVFAYVDTASVVYGERVPSISCAKFDEMRTVEDYLREHIVETVTSSAVAGGTWYVVSAIVDSESDTGTVVYEDGHVQYVASFSYSYDDETDEVVVSNFMNLGKKK